MSEQPSDRDNSFLPPEGEVYCIANLVQRYEVCALRIWELFPTDPLSSDDPAQFWIERLESILDRGLLGHQYTWLSSESGVLSHRSNGTAYGGA